MEQSLQKRVTDVLLPSGQKHGVGGKDSFLVTLGSPLPELQGRKEKPRKGMPLTKHMHRRSQSGDYNMGRGNFWGKKDWMGLGGGGRNTNRRKARKEVG